MVPGSPIHPDKDDEKYFKAVPNVKKAPKEEEKKANYAKEAVLKEPKKLPPKDNGPA